MPRRSSRRADADLAAIILVFFLVAGFSAHQSLSFRTVVLVGSAIGLVATLIISAALYFSLLRLAQGRRKLRALQAAAIQSMDGLQFERYVAELLRCQGYSHVSLTERYDYGVDIIAIKDGIRWGVQVKRYRGLVKAAAVRQVVTGLNLYRCQRAMVVTNSVFSKPARKLADSNRCVLVDRDSLAEWIIAYQNGAHTIA